MAEHIILALALVAATTFGVLFYWHRKERRQLETEGLSFRTLAENSLAGIWRTDPDGNCVYVNKAWEQMADMHNGEWRGSGWGNALHPADRDRVIANFTAATFKLEKFEEELCWQRPDGSILWVRTLGAPEFDSSGRLLGYVGTNIDIQESKELQDKLALALQKAEQAAASKSTFLANMSHEIRTPMNGVIGFTELLLDADLPDDQRAHVQLIADSGRAMMRLLNEILDVAKIESGHMLINYEPTDLRQKLRHSARLLEPLAKSNKLNFGVWVDDAVPDLVQTDALRLRQIILNLVGNAVKFTETGGIDLEARVENSSKGRYLLISVIDTGVGIEQSRLDAIFEPFSQENSSVMKRHGGSGLGLTISNQLVEMMDGTITVHSKPGVGTNFTVRLPLIEASPDETAKPIEVEGLMPALTHLQGVRLLIAEDHAINQQLILAMMSSLGLDATLVENGEEAIAAVVRAEEAGQPFHAILMDVQMPEVDGLEATRRLRALGFGAESLPIIALTANCYPDDIAACKKAGMQSHLGKPVTTVTLARELARCFPQPAVVNHDTYYAGEERRAARPGASLADLEHRYVDRKGQLFTILRESLGDNPEAIDWDNLAGELHKLAGIAANFGEAELGEASSRLERRLRLTPEPHLRLAALRREWPSFEEAASVTTGSLSRSRPKGRLP